MFRYLKSIILASLIGGLSSTAALAQNPFAPSLSLNENPEICSAFLGAWVDVYNGAKRLEDRSVDLKAAFPDANHISPTEDKVNAGYGNTSHVEFDYDGDGGSEVLYFESEHPRSDYGGTGIYFYKSREDFDSEAAADTLFGRFQSWHKFYRENPDYDTGKKARILALYRKLQVAHIFQKDGHLYSQSNMKRVGGTRYKPGKPQKITLDLLTITNPPKPICEIDFTIGAIERNLATLNLDAIAKPNVGVLAPLGNMYGGRLNGTCHGTMGFTALPIYVHLEALYYRPQSMMGVNHRGEFLSQNPAADAAREFRFITWGLSDPSSFEVIRELKSHYPQFITDFTAYYQTYFGMDEAAAKNMAELGYRYLLDKVVYGRSNDIHSSAFSGLNFGPENSLEEIANLLVDKALKEKLVNAGVLKLGMMAGVEADKLIPLADTIVEYVEAQELKASISLSKKSTKQITINQLFLASSTHPEMLQYFLDRGADVDFPTNYFQKTALMYAAQNNNLDAVVSLLKNGADPNSKTEFKPEPRQFCLPPLKRDARTPLMYAAENADATLILTMLEAGADLTAKDTQDNDVLWYLEQNKVVSDEQKVNLQMRLAAQ